MLAKIGEKYLVTVPRLLVAPFIVPATAMVLRNFMSINKVLLEEIIVLKDIAQYLRDDDLLEYGIKYEFAPNFFDGNIPVLTYSDDCLYDVSSENLYDLIRLSIKDRN